MLSDGWDADWMGLSLGLMKERGAQIGAVAPDGAVGIGMGTPASSLRIPASWHCVPISVPVLLPTPPATLALKKRRGKEKKIEEGIE